MTGRILGFVAAMLALTVCVHAAPAAEKSVWDGVWTGNFGNGSKISVTVADNKVTNYSIGERLSKSHTIGLQMEPSRSAIAKTTRCR
jgi:hypothetical protein